MRTLRWICGLVAVCTALAVAVRVLHGTQQQRNAAAVMAQARAATAAGRAEDAITCWRHYLGFVPNDLEALTELGLALDEVARDYESRCRAFLTLEEVLRSRPDRDEVRRRVVHLAMAIERYDDALAHLELLRRNAADDAELVHLTGRCLEATGRFQEAMRCYEAAIERDPPRIESYERLAGLLRRRFDLSQEADQRLDQMVAANQQSSRAFVVRAQQHKEAGRLDAAAADVARAMELADDDADARIVAAQVAIAQAEQLETTGADTPAAAKLDEARALLDRTRERHPREVRAHLLLAVVELKRKRNESAIAVLRRGLEANPRQPDLVWRLVDVLIQTRQLDEARRLMDGLRREGFPRAPLGYLEARLLMQYEKWSEATRLLEEIRPLLALSPELTTQADLLLGQCNERLGDTSRQLAAYRRATKGDPLLVAARFGVASSLLGLGRVNEAIGEYREMIRLRGAPAAAKLELARLLILHNLLAAASERNWWDATQALDAAEEALGSSPLVAVLRAEALAAQQRAPQAATLLERATQQWPESADVWLARATLAERQGDSRAAIELLHNAGQRLGNRPEVLLAEATYWAKQGGPQARQRLSELRRRIGELPPGGRSAALRGVAEAHYHVGLIDPSRKLWQEAAELEPNNLGLRLHLFDLALQAGDEAAMTRTLAEIRRIEGDLGVLGTYGEVCRLIRRAQAGERDLLAAARTKLTAVAGGRPTWSRVPLREAELDELEGNPSRAIENYQRAIEMGERSHGVLRHVVGLLYERRRFVEADQVIRRMQELAETPISSDLQRLAAELSLQIQDHKRALEMAQEAVAAALTDFRNHIWLGQVLWAVGRRAEAETPLRKAVELNDQAAETWAALVQYLARVGRSKDAELTIEQLERKLPQNVGVLVAAQCYEALGQFATAAERYRRALQAQPDELGVLRGAASFYLRRAQHQAAEPVLRRMTEPRVNAPKDELAWARRNLAVLLGTRRSYPASQAAIQLVEQNKAAGDASIENRRAEAVVYATHPSRLMRRRAVGQFEELARFRPLSADDQFLLVQVLEADGDWSKARSEMRTLLAIGGDNPLYLAHCARMLLRRGEPDQAQLWLDQLEKCDAVGFRTFEVRARVLVAQEKAGEALALLREYAAGGSQARNASLGTNGGNARRPTANLQLGAALLEELGDTVRRAGQEAVAAEFYGAAETLLGKLASESPEHLLRLATYLGRRGRAREALETCERAWRSGTAEAVAFASVDILRASSAGPEACADVRRAIDAALLKTPTSTGLLLARANLLDYQQQFGAAEQVYRRVLAIKGDDVTALNNLAWLLAQQGSGPAAESLKLIERAIARAGALPELLDSRAAAYVTLGQAPCAIEDLGEALAADAIDGPGRAVHYFHLAAAHLAAQHPDDARTALRHAQAAGLAPDRLHPLERPRYDRLLADLGPLTASK
jgi:tetratricopeptide (TPR) repeat protein